MSINAAAVEGPAAYHRLHRAAVGDRDPRADRPSIL
jgi:hypothetical protein